MWDILWRLYGNRRAEFGGVGQRLVLLHTLQKRQDGQPRVRGRGVGMRSFGKLRISARGSNAAQTPQLRLRRNYVPAALSMTMFTTGASQAMTRNA